MNLTTQQLAEILIGVARTQQAVIDAIESSKAGFKGTHLAPALDSVAKLRATGRPPSLQDYPARVLLQCQGRAGPNVEQIVRDLDALLSGQPPAPAGIAPAPAAPRAAAASRAAPEGARAAPAPSATVAANAGAVATATADDDNDLDMTKI